MERVSARGGGKGERERQGLGDEQRLCNKVGQKGESKGGMASFMPGIASTLRSALLQGRP